ncbi:amidohydrolase family protein [Rhodoferax aquaticus]|uniref:Amidohydrolase n=1 Tax=Rhodoferax aquaticus TaxID=2527691 RepID=A0A515EPI7_9BURK|nr:amidohydrolase family protein [Rhodoferax aquaticus]QDL54535.1 amidohydrolase [Rhodoferax aquaticus]
MKIDTHQHYWRYRAQEFPWIADSMPLLKRDRLPTDVESAMANAGVTGAVAVQARSVAAETDFLLQLADQVPSVMGVVGWADLRAGDLQQQLDRWCAHPAFKGLRHILQDESDVSDWVNDVLVNFGLRTLQQRHLVYDVLVYHHQLPLVHAFCAAHDTHWLALDHMAKPAVRDWARAPDALREWGRNLDILGTLPHVMCKLSGAVTETDWAVHGAARPADAKVIWSCFDRALDAFGPNRIMFGSDWPVCQLAAPYESVYDLASQWAAKRLSESEQTAFWSGNALRCYGLTA